MKLSILGPFPCGASRCSCTKGGCDELGALSEEAKEEVVQLEQREREAAASCPQKGPET